MIGLALLYACRPVEVLSPSDGSTQFTAEIPIVVHTRDRDADAEVEVRLDGKDRTDPFGFVRRRLSNHGDGQDYLAMLDLLDLEPGEHELEIEFHRKHGTTRRSVTFTYDPWPCRVDATVTDSSKRPLSARIVVTRDGALFDIGGSDAAAADPASRDDPRTSFMAIEGAGSVLLQTGTYRLLAIRGVREEMSSRDVVCGDGDRVGVDFTIDRAFDIAGDPIAADLHVHTGHSSDAYLPDRLRYQSLLASGLDLFVITDHNAIVDPARTLAELYADAITGFPGAESAMGRTVDKDEYSYGHTNAYPLSDREPLPTTEIGTHPEGMIDDFRARQKADPFDGLEDVVVQLNHPRGLQFFFDDNPGNGHALFAQMGFDPALPIDDPENDWVLQTSAAGTRAMDFDSMEILNRFSWPLYREVRADWFRFLRSGFWLTGVGDSDSHAYEVEQAGYPQNLIDCPVPPVGTRVDPACLVTAIREGRVTVSNGPVVTLTVDDGTAVTSPGGTATATDIVVHVRVQAAAWVPVDEVRIVEGGEIVYEAEVPASARQEDGSLDFAVERSIAVSADSFVLAEAGWPLGAAIPSDRVAALGDYGLAVYGHLPLGFTNAVRIDADADGTWFPLGD